MILPPACLLPVLLLGGSCIKRTWQQHALQLPCQLSALQLPKPWGINWSAFSCCTRCAALALGWLACRGMRLTHCQPAAGF